jgi:hypothetical protein
LILVFDSCLAAGARRVPVLAVDAVGFGAIAGSAFQALSLTAFCLIGSAMPESHAINSENSIFSL